MNREEIRMMLWCVAAANHGFDRADTLVSHFDQRFPAESSDPLRRIAELESALRTSLHEKDRVLSNAELQEKADEWPNGNA